MGPKASSGHYATLGVDNSSSSAAIKAAFRKLALQHHPDRESGNAEKFRVGATPLLQCARMGCTRACVRAYVHACMCGEPTCAGALPSLLAGHNGGI